MLENLSELLAILATVFGTLMSLGYFPQTLKIIKRKSSADVSVTTYLIFTPGILIWLLYGISLNNLALILSNVVALIGAFSIIITYFYYRK
jgi:MtN3 and saliva related transmembrane protein